MKRILPSLLAALLAFGTSSPMAQSRTFPERTRLGTLQVDVFPQARLDGKPVVLAPGVRLRDTGNLIVAPQTLRDRAVPVRYTLDPMGQVSEAWALTPSELERAKQEARDAKAGAAAK